MRDYDGFISDWLEARLLPLAVEEFVEFVKMNSSPDRPVLEVGCGKGLVSAALGEAGYSVTAVDTKYPAIVEPFDFMLTDAKSEEFFLLLENFATLVARRTLCLLYSDEWIERLNASPVTTLLLESLNGEKHRFRNSTIEAAFLVKHGWKVEVNGKYIKAIRKLPKQPQKPEVVEIELHLRPEVDVDQAIQQALETLGLTE